jgi:hypothetical protein
MLTDFLFRSVGASPFCRSQLRRILTRLPSRRIVAHRGQRLIVDPTELSGYYEQAYDRDVFDFLETVVSVEGAEWMALTGASSILRNHKTLLTLLLEIHPAEIDHGGNVEALYRFLLEAGFRVRTVTTAGLVDFSPKDPPRFWWASGDKSI